MSIIILIMCANKQVIKEYTQFIPFKIPTNKKRENIPINISINHITLVDPQS